MRKIKTIFYLLLVLLTMSFYNQKNYSFQKKNNLNSKDTLEWNKNIVLKWNDFKLDPKNEKNQGLKKYKAISYCGINVELIKEYSDSIVIKVNSYFNRAKSWTKDTSLYLLNHECRHFDIVEFCSRQLKKEISLINNLSRDSSIIIINHKINQVEKTRKEIQNLYDDETNHSIKIDQQKKWNQKIEIMLKSSDEYKNQFISVRIKK